MPSPFPGMAPCLEGYLWPDVDSALANKIRQHLAPLLRPRYVARLGTYVVEDSAPEGEIGILYPDVEVLHTDAAVAEQPVQHPAFAATPATLATPALLPVEVQLVVVEVRDAASNVLVTSIEILSPVNKREPGLTHYRLKRQRLYQAGVHLIELDLLRRGTRPVDHPRLRDAPYVVTLTRMHAGTTDAWPLTLREPLPGVPVPLHAPDDDVLLDLAAALAAVYDEAAYNMSIDYQQAPPPPALSPDDQQWLRRLIQPRT